MVSENQTFSIFNDKKKSIELCVNRFDADTRAAFVDLYEKIDAGMDEANTAVEGEYSYDVDASDSTF